MNARLNRLMGADGRCFDVAIDHGFFGEVTFLSGIENMEGAVRAVVQAAPDAVQLSVGQAKWLQSIPGKQKPSLVLRSDVANVYGNALPSVLFSELIQSPLEQALRLDAACLVVNLLMLPNQPALHQACIRNVNLLKPLCERYGVPLMVEPLVMQENHVAGGYMVDDTLEKILPLVRQATELGADIIKADPCDDVGQYHEVIAVAGDVPVLVRGGGRVADLEVLKRTHALLRQGARGIVYGRNIIQHANPTAMTKALMALVHDQASVQQAKKILNAKNLSAKSTGIKTK